MINSILAGLLSGSDSGGGDFSFLKNLNYQGGGGEAGGEGGISGLLQNKLFLQYLSGAGSALQQGEPIGPALDKATQQNIASQNYMKVLSQMLSGGGKMSIDKDKFSLSAPTSMLEKSEKSGGGGGGMFLGKNPLGVGAMNPFKEDSSPFVGSQSGIKASDLAGLTTQDLSSILQGGLNIEQLKQKKITDIADAMYKRDTAETARIGKLIELQKLFRESPLSVPGLGKLTMDEWNSLDTKTKAYSYYAFNEKQNNRSPLPYNDWVQSSDQNSIIEIYNEAKKDPEFKKFFFEQKVAGAPKISLDSKLEEVKAKGGLKGQLYFKDPDWIKDLDKHMSSSDVQSKIMSVPGKSGSEEYKLSSNKAKVDETVKFIEDRVVGGGGEIVSRSYDKGTKTAVWTIKWPSGDTEKVRYVFK